MMQDVVCDLRKEARKAVNDVARAEGKYIELHRSAEDANKVMVHVPDIAVIENDGRYCSPTLITLRGSGKKIQVIESYSDVVAMVNEVVGADKPIKIAKQYVKADTNKFYGVRSVIIDRKSGTHYGVLCNNVDDNYLICVEMRDFDDYLYPWMGSSMYEIRVSDVEK